MIEERVCKEFNGCAYGKTGSGTLADDFPVGALPCPSHDR